jgi:hypothetical protein
MIKNYMQMMSKLANEGREAASRFVFRLRHYRLPGRLGLASPPNADSLAVALDVEQRASLDGGNNLPSASEEVISGSQREIVDHHRRLHDKARRKVKKLSAKLLAEARRRRRVRAICSQGYFLRDNAGGRGSGIPRAW